MTKLNARQQAFVLEYLIDLNATQAAIRAGYSKRTAYSQGQRLLKHAEVSAAIRKGQTERAEATQVSAEMVLERLRLEAEGQGPDTSSGARIRAAELLGKHIGMFTDRQEHTGDVRIRIIRE